MEEEKGLIKVLKWAGIVALVAVPLVVLLKKRKGEKSVSSSDDNDIFESELKG